MWRETSGQKAKEERAGRLGEARASLANGAATVKYARDVVARAEAAEQSKIASRQARLAANEVATALQLGELSTDLIGVTIARLALAKLIDGVDALHEALKALPTIESAMADVDSADMIMV